MLENINANINGDMKSAIDAGIINGENDKQAGEVYNPRPLDNLPTELNSLDITNFLQRLFEIGYFKGYYLGK